jgi:hypothetical protein
MNVEYRPLKDSVLEACKRLASSSEEEEFSAQQVSETTHIPLKQVLERMDWLQENGWIDRLKDGLIDQDLPNEVWFLHEQKLTSGRLYEVLGIEGNYYRILTDENDVFNPNDPVLYSSTGFVIHDANEPAFWITEVGADGERYCCPSEWMVSGFWEDYHDGVKTVFDQFWDGVRKYYPWTWSERKGDS